MNEQTLTSPAVRRKRRVRPNVGEKSDSGGPNVSRGAARRVRVHGKGERGPRQWSQATYVLTEWSTYRPAMNTCVEVDVCAKVRVAVTSSKVSPASCVHGRIGDASSNLKMVFVRTRMSRLTNEMKLTCGVEHADRTRGRRPRVSSGKFRAA